MNREALKELGLTDELQEITVTTDDGEVIASISLTEGSGFVKNGYKVTGFDKQETC